MFEADDPGIAAVNADADHGDQADEERDDRLGERTVADRGGGYGDRSERQRQHGRTEQVAAELRAQNQATVATGSPAAAAMSVKLESAIDMPPRRVCRLVVSPAV